MKETSSNSPLFLEAVLNNKQTETLKSITRTIAFIAMLLGATLPTNRTNSTPFLPHSAEPANNERKESPRDPSLITTATRNAIGSVTDSSPNTGDSPGTNEIGMKIVCIFLETLMQIDREQPNNSTSPYNCDNNPHFTYTVTDTAQNLGIDTSRWRTPEGSPNRRPQVINRKKAIQVLNGLLEKNDPWAILQVVQGYCVANAYSPTFTGANRKNRRNVLCEKLSHPLSAGRVQEAMRYLSTYSETDLTSSFAQDVVLGENIEPSLDAYASLFPYIYLPVNKKLVEGSRFSAEINARLERKMKNPHDTSHKTFCAFMNQALSLMETDDVSPEDIRTNGAEILATALKIPIFSARAEKIQKTRGSEEKLVASVQ